VVWPGQAPIPGQPTHLLPVSLLPCDTYSRGAWGSFWAFLPTQEGPHLPLPLHTLETKAQIKKVTCPVSQIMGQSWEKPQMSSHGAHTPAHHTWNSLHLFPAASWSLSWHLPQTPGL
jgi:hypothetical protein